MGCLLWVHRLNKGSDFFLTCCVHYRVVFDRDMSRSYIFITQIMPCLICGNHHQIGSMNYCPLFRVRSWNNGMRCMSFYILMEAFSTLLALCAGNSPVTGEFPSQRPVTRTFDVFFGLCLNKRLSKQSRHRWFETPSRSLWRHCSAMA